MRAKNVGMAQKMNAANAEEAARALFLRALDHHNHQRLQEAEQLYRQALGILPGRISLLVNLGAVLIAQGRFAEAKVFARRALEVDPEHQAALEHLAQCELATASARTQLEALENSILAQPGEPGLHNNRGLLLQGLSRLPEALASFSEASRLAPSEPAYRTNRATVLEAMGRHAEAFGELLAVLRSSPDFDAAGHGFVRILQETGFGLHSDTNELDVLLVRAITRPWASPHAVAALIIRRLYAMPEIAALIERNNADDDRRDGELEPESPLLRCELLLALMQHSLVADLALERVLTRLRRSLLDDVDRDLTIHRSNVTTDVFHAALAMQCFLNEYIYPATPGESDKIESLEDRLEQCLREGSTPPLRWLAAVASYRPLYRLAGCDALLRCPWSPAARALITQQLVEPETERRMMPLIPRLTGIQDRTSAEVREQYEKNPYPRWTHIPRVATKAPLHEYVQRRGGNFAGCRGDESDGVSNALIAGCGTGQHAVDVALRIDRLRLLAVDLSLASLAHAKRKAKELDLLEIEFGQADILELGSLPRRFDLVECVGVLHHLQNPAQGLAVLRQLLKDGGVMRLGLYSEIARRSIVECRKDITARQLQSCPETIRQYREEIRGLPGGDPRKGVTRFLDFYSTSECRDLLFHVQEHRFTVPQLQALLGECGLEFAGFELAPACIDAFVRTRGDAALYDLDVWHEHEQQHPDTFASMYIFWARKQST